MQSVKASRYVLLIIFENIKEYHSSFCIHLNIYIYLPTIARFDDNNVFFAPDGNLILVFPPSGLCETIVA